MEKKGSIGGEVTLKFDGEGKVERVERGGTWE